jgi:hypothetical protein
VEFDLLNQEFELQLPLVFAVSVSSRLLIVPSIVEQRRIAP